MKIERIIWIFLFFGFISSQEKTEKTPLEKTDKDTAEILKDFKRKPELLLCIGIFTKIPKTFLDEKINPLKSVLKDEKLFGNYVDRYFFNAMVSCMNKVKTSEEEKVFF